MRFVWPPCVGMDIGRPIAISYFKPLPHTLGLGSEVWRVLDKCHSVRNLGEYEGDLNVDERLVADLIAACRSVR
jgi:hypothetical protein